MKSLIRILLPCVLLGASVLVSGAAMADGLMVLWWQVGDAEDFSEDGESLKNVKVTLANGETTSAYDLGVYEARIRETSTGTYLGMLDPEDVSETSFTFESMFVPTVWQADITDFASDSAGYAFVIELGNYEDGTWSTLAISETATYGDLVSSHAIVDTNLGIDPSVLAPWNPTSYVVPEPNSGMLVLVGAVLLVLRRKRERAHG